MDPSSSSSSSSEDPSSKYYWKVGGSPSMMTRFHEALLRGLSGPAEFIDNTLKPFKGQSYPWYHRRYRRVPTIDECYVDDVVCREEANYQYKRDRKVDKEVTSILKYRYEDCLVYEGSYATHGDSICQKLHDTWKENMTNFYIKYGDIAYYGRVEDAFMKQKHRMVFERRHGPVGSIKANNEESKE